jgi:hypothetical protein
MFTTRCLAGLFVLVALGACRKTPAPPYRYSADGWVEDTVKGQRVPGMAVYLYANADPPGFWGAGPAVDSTVTDANGQFSFKEIFNSNHTRRGYLIFDYSISIMRLDTNGVLVSGPVIPYLQGGANELPVRYIYPGTNHNLDIQARYLGKATIHVIIDNNPYLNVQYFLSPNSFYNGNGYVGRYGSGLWCLTPHLDTTLIANYLPLDSNYLNFFVDYMPDSPQYTRYRLQAFVPHAMDTAFTVHLSSVYDLPLVQH